MNATAGTIRNNKTSQKYKRKTTIPTNGRIYPMDKTPQRPIGNTQGQTEICAHKPTADAFLKWTFLPKHEKTKELVQGQEPNNISQLEKDCYQSLFQLAEHYKVKLKPTQKLGYPYNIALALEDIQNQLQNKTRDWEDIRLVKDENTHHAYFTSEERFHTGSILFYIPIIPLYRLSKKRKRKSSAELLKSVFSYLYHIADVPYYRQQSSYLFWMYEMISDWIFCDEQNEEQAIYLSEIKQAEQIGDIIERKICHSKHLTDFKKRLKQFKAKDSLDNDCFMLAGKFFSLYEQYPNASIHQNIKAYKQSNEIEEQENSISINQYVSFCSEAKGVLFDTLFDCINSEFQEYGTIEQPTIVKRFNGEEVRTTNLNFEKQLFPLIEELIFLLNTF